MLIYMFPTHPPLYPQKLWPRAPPHPASLPLLMRQLIGSALAQVLDSPEQNSRLLLVTATLQVIKQTNELLGIGFLDKI